MSITFKVNSKSEPKISEKMKVLVRRTIDGKIIIDEHPNLSIVLDPYEKIVTAYPKDSYSSDVYFYQDKLFTYLTKKGLIERETVNSGAAYASMEGSYPDTNDEVNLTHLVLINIIKFILEVKPDIEFEKWLENEHEKLLSAPEEEDTTELGEVPAKTSKGVIDPTNRIRRYMGGYYSY